VKTKGESKMIILYGKKKGDGAVERLLCAVETSRDVVIATGLWGKKGFEVTRIIDTCAESTEKSK
jgi:hypothetical protein